MTPKVTLKVLPLDVLSPPLQKHVHPPGREPTYLGWTLRTLLNDFTSGPGGLSRADQAEAVRLAPEELRNVLYGQAPMLSAMQLRRLGSVIGMGETLTRDLLIEHTPTDLTPAEFAAQYGEHTLADARTLLEIARADALRAQYDTVIAIYKRHAPETLAAVWHFVNGPHMQPPQHEDLHTRTHYGWLIPPTLANESPPMSKTPAPGFKPLTDADETPATPAELAALATGSGQTAPQTLNEKHTRPNTLNIGRYVHYEYPEGYKIPELSADDLVKYPRAAEHLKNMGRTATASVVGLYSGPGGAASQQVCDLRILYGNDAREILAVPFSPTPKPGHWTWRQPKVGDLVIIRTLRIIDDPAHPGQSLPDDQCPSIWVPALITEDVGGGLFNLEHDANPYINRSFGNGPGQFRFTVENVGDLCR